MTLHVQYFSYFKDLTGCEHEQVSVESGTTVGALHEDLIRRHPRLESMRRSTLIAVGLDYQPPGHVLNDGDRVSLFPPVQGG